jgi:tripartite-type tricarboxylate transporter receptor subunit TctC
MKRRTFNFSIAAAAASATSGLRAQAIWPQRPVKWILSQPAGAGPDILARYVADQLSKVWGQTIVIDNRPGGQNVIGAQAAARSAPDGYTFYYATTAAMVTNAFTFKTLPYDAAKDFASVRLIGRSPFVIAAAANFPAKSLAEAIAMAKAKPGEVAIATEGPKTFSGMLADSVAAMAGVKFNHVPYTKASDAIQDVIGGRVQLICLPDAALVAYFKGGQMRPLAISTLQPSPTLPGVPPLSDNFAGFEFTGWNGVFAPAGTPGDIVAKMNRDLDAVLKQPEVQQRLLTLGSIAESSMTVTEFDAFMRNERERWGRIVKTIGIVPE